MTNNTHDSDSTNRIELMKLDGNRRFRELIEQAGGAYTSSEVANLLGIEANDVSLYAEQKKLLAVKMDGTTAFPVWQFHGDTVVAGFEEVLNALNFISSVTQTSFFLSNIEQLGMTPVDYIIKHGADERILRLARTMGQHGAS
jgi:hypothetical protein